MINTILLSAVLSTSPLLDINDADWKLRLKREVAINSEPALLYRYERSDNQNTGLYGEHLSFLTGEKGLLKGFVKYTSEHKNSPLPTREKALEVSDKFLEQVAPDLLNNRKINWIKPHDEVIKVQDKTNSAIKEITITGMKVKQFNTATGLYFWTLIDANHQVFIFERDIKWITFPGRRATEKWLHDSYLAEKWGGLED